jgi:DNA polymerase III epsilon subunit-like protein
MIYPIYVLDTETTGLNPKNNDIIEVCFWRDGEPESKTWHLKPVHPENIEDEALAVNGHKKEDILHKTQYGRDTYREPCIVLPEIEAWLMEDGAAAEDRIIVGHNPDFDHDFLVECWGKQSSLENFPFGYWRENRDGSKRNIVSKVDTIDLVTLVDVCCNKRRKAHNLSACVKAFKITKAQAHRADGDVKMTKDLFEMIMAPLRAIFIEKFSDCY